MSAVMTTAAPSAIKIAYAKKDPSRIVGFMTPDEYFAYDRARPERYEYWEGWVIEMAGGSPEHNMISMDLAVTLSVAFQTMKADCGVFGSDQKVFITEDKYFYPDVTVACGEPQFDFKDGLRNPVALFEVLSDSTEKDDRTTKFRQYQTLPTVHHYVLIDQNQAAVTHYEKLITGLWAIAGDYTTLTDTLKMTLGGEEIAVPLAAIYRRVAPAETQTP